MQLDWAGWGATKSHVAFHRKTFHSCPPPSQRASLGGGNPVAAATGPAEGDAMERVDSRPSGPGCAAPPAPAASVSSQADYLCFLSAGGNGSDTGTTSSINKCRGLIAQWALAQEAAGPCLVSFISGCAQPAQEAMRSAGEARLAAPSIFLVEEYLLCANCSPSRQPRCSRGDSLSPLWKGEKVTGRDKGAGSYYSRTFSPHGCPRTEPVLKVARSHCSTRHPSSPEEVCDTDLGSISSSRHSATSLSQGGPFPTVHC